MAAEVMAVELVDVLLVVGIFAAVCLLAVRSQDRKDAAREFRRQQAALRRVSTRHTEDPR